MSNARFSITPSRAVKDKDLSDSQFRTLSALGIYGDENGWCWPSLGTLAKDLNKSKPAVSKDIKSLKEKGYLNVYKRFSNDTGEQQSNRYQLRFDYPPLTPEVNPPFPSEVNPPLTPEVNLNVPFNETINAPIAGEISLEQRGDLVDGFLHFAQKANGTKDMAAWPEDTRTPAQDFARVFGLAVPESKTARADWIEAVRNIRKDAQGLPLAVVFEEGKRLAEKENWLTKIGRPAALLKSLPRITRNIQHSLEDNLPVAADGSFYV